MRASSGQGQMPLKDQVASVNAGDSGLGDTRAPAYRETGRGGEGGRFRHAGVRRYTTR